MKKVTKKNIVKIMVFGTFDGLHLGHINFFKQARRLGGSKAYLIVSIARDRNVFRIKKRHPNLSEKGRVLLLKKSKLADKVVLSGIKNHLPHILDGGPDIIALGYDQKFYVKNLKEDLKKEGLNVRVVRLKSYKKNIFKNRLLHVVQTKRKKTSKK